MKKHWTMIVPGAVLMAGLAASPAEAVDLKTAIQQALQTNPEIHQAVQNKAATRWERRQAEGLYYPRLSVELSGGVRELKNPSRRALNIASDTLYPLEAQAMVEQLLMDNGAREHEIRYQAARTDAAAARIEERSEFIALNTSRAYIDYLLQQRLVAIEMDNAAFHQRLAGDLRQGVQQGSISIADQQQAEERLAAAQARVVEAQEELDYAAIEFERLTGMPIGDVTMPPDLSGAMPESLYVAEQMARNHNPLVQESAADLAAARELIMKAKAEMGPRFSLEGRARVGTDIDGFEGDTTDLMARGVMRWTLFDGMANSANVREQQARANQQHALLFEQQRKAVETVRQAWSRLQNQGRLVDALTQQNRVSDDLLLSYREQFNVGRRSLLDVLDAQNTRANVQAQLQVATLAQLYAQYRVLAATNNLLEAMGLDMASEAWSGERDEYSVLPVYPGDYDENTIVKPLVVGPPASDD
ncbi:TolC family protein [Sphingomicrobium lutaoense]|uniref:Adhesin transport system outer membrane protein n=1 Tax=Sphingomicrobium lutaoense TaxID=515949 RepID=A0A839Z344_9SPHN|nr:TolC family protein [Sphingomicrobium lutaoense]MBB3763004.1 adhesin transport system outer membrane protein [Sphingomicrobium lutaoense]